MTISIEVDRDLLPGRDGPGEPRDDLHGDLRARHDRSRERTPHFLMAVNCRMGRGRGSRSRIDDRHLVDGPSVSALSAKSSKSAEAFPMRSNAARVFASSASVRAWRARNLASSTSAG